MIPTLEKYYLDRFEMFTTAAWKDLIADMEEQRAATDRIGGIKTEAELHFKRGELSIQNWLIGLQAMSENAYKEIQADESSI